MGKRPRFFAPFGGAECSDETERLAELAVGDATSVPPMLSGMPVPVGILAEIPRSFTKVLLSLNILPKSTGAEELIFVQGTSPGASALGDGLPGNTGEMRELDTFDAS